MPGELLGDGAATLRRASLAQVGPGRPEDPHKIDALMAFEPLILERDDRLAQVWRDARERDLDAIFPEDRENRTVIHVIERRGLRHLAECPKRITARQPGKQRPDRHDNSKKNRRHGSQNRSRVYQEPPLEFLERPFE